jgi:hypothetical protein
VTFGGTASALAPCHPAPSRSEEDQETVQWTVSLSLPLNCASARFGWFSTPRVTGRRVNRPITPLQSAHRQRTDSGLDGPLQPGGVQHDAPAAVGRTLVGGLGDEARRLGFRAVVSI